MKNTMKKRLFTLSAATALTCAAMGAVMAVQTAQADGQAFVMENGAYVRLTNDYETFGIRFTATVVDETQSYNMLILPLELVSAYDKDNTENKADIVPYMIQKFGEERLSIAKNLSVKNGKISGSIVNILWENINRDFVGFAYYIDGNEYVVAERASDYSRSVVDICQNALRSGDYDVKDTDSETVKTSKLENRELLLEKIRFGEKQAKGFAKEDVYIYEDFSFADTNVALDKQFNVDVATVGTDSAESLAIVDNGDGYGLQFTRLKDKYDLLTFDFGTQQAGTYKLSFKMKENALAQFGYNNWKLMGWGGTKVNVDYGYLFEKYYVGNDTFEYYFETETDVVKFGIAGLTAEETFAGQGQILLDEVCLEEVEEIPTKTYALNTLSQKVQTFENAVSPFMSVHSYGVYTRYNTKPTLHNGKLSMSVKSNEGLVFYLGDVTKGQYKLALDFETTGGYPAVVQIATMTIDETTGKITYADVQTLYNAAGVNFADMARKTGETSYELPLRFDNAYSNLCVILYDNVQNEDERSVSVDNVSFAALDYTTAQTLADFENGLLNFCSSAGAWSEKAGLLNAANAHFDYRTTKGQLVTEDNNTYYQVAINSTNSYARLSLGWFNAGTYTFSFRAKASGSNLNGGTTLSECYEHPTSPLTSLTDSKIIHNKTDFTFTNEWTEYSVTVTLTEAKYIKFGFNHGSAKNGNYTVCVDDFAVIKTA